MNKAQSIPKRLPKIKNRKKMYFLDLYCWIPIANEITYTPTDNKAIMVPKFQFK